MEGTSIRTRANVSANNPIEQLALHTDDATSA
jgi:hypothetical protein